MDLVAVGVLREHPDRTARARGHAWPHAERRSAPYESAAREAAEEAQARVDDLRGRAGLDDVHWTGEVIAGPSAEVIDAAARNDDADGIYIGSRGAGRASALLGSIAHEVLHLADRPVTVITERAAARADAPG